MAYGPVQYFVCVFPGNQFRADIVPALADVVSRGAIRIVDMAFVRKDAGGSTQTLEINDLDDDAFNAYGELLERTEGVLSDGDVQDFADRIRPDSAAALIVFEAMSRILQTAFGRTVRPR
jgi:hypothetical protein